MTTYFVDTSALAKRYLNEIGARWVRSWIEPSAGHVVIISDLSAVEMFSLLARRQREQSVSNADLGIARTDFLLHVEREYLTVSLDAAVLVQARTLVSRHPLRALDAIQLAAALRASALLAETIVFVSGDNNLLLAANAEGLAIDNPLLHP